MMVAFGMRGLDATGMDIAFNVLPCAAWFGVRRADSSHTLSTDLHSGEVLISVIRHGEKRLGLARRLSLQGRHKSRDYRPNDPSAAVTRRSAVVGYSLRLPLTGPTV